MKKVLLVIGGILLVIAVAFLIFMQSTKSSMDKAEKMVAVDINTVADGSYDGEAELGPVKVVVRVTVKAHKIEKIDLVKHQNGMGQGAEVLVDTMTEKNTVEVDAVSGATTSSLTIRLAVNNALAKGAE